MPSRRQFVAAAGAAAFGVLAGCGLTDATTGTVTRKRITVAVPRRDDPPVDASVAILAYEPDRRLVHGEYDPAYVDAAVDGGRLSAPEAVHDRLVDRFAAVRYGVNVVPESGTPANGLVDREAFDALALGGTATVGTDVGSEGYGRLHVRETTDPEREPADVTVNRFSLDERGDS